MRRTCTVVGSMWRDIELDDVQPQLVRLVQLLNLYFIQRASALLCTTAVAMALRRLILCSDRCCSCWG
jgi:hypothetical protein